MKKFINILIIILLFTIIGSIFYFTYKTFDKKANYILVVNKVDATMQSQNNIIDTIFLNNKSFDELKPNEVGNVLDHTSNFLTYATLLMGFVAFLATMMGFFTYQQFQKTSEIRNEIENMFDRKKKDLTKYVILSLSSHFSLFNKSLDLIIKSYRNIIPNNVTHNGQVEDTLAKLSELNDIFNHIRNLQFSDIDKINSAIMFLGNKNIFYNRYLEDFINLRQDDESYKDSVKLAEGVISRKLYNT